MKIKIVKCFSAGSLVLAAAWVPAHAQRICSNRTLSGEYSSSFSGQLLSGPLAGLVNGITLETFDGNGSFTSKDHVVLSGVQPTEEWRESSGTYIVHSDCTGEKQTNFLNNQPPPRITYFVITEGGRRLNIVGGNSGAALTGVYTRGSARGDSDDE